MRNLIINVGSFARRKRGIALSFVVASLISIGPAHAQDLFGFLRLFSPPQVSVSPPNPYDYSAPPDLERPAPRRRPKVVRVDASPPVKMAVKPRAMGEATNPVPELLTDSTLRVGDMVMFPDGLRVFTGNPGAQHALKDFEPVSRAAHAVSPSTRKLVTGLRPGWNGAWSVHNVGSGARLASNTRDLETTGSVPWKRR